MANTIRELINNSPECLDLPILLVLCDGSRVETEINVDDICPPSENNCDGKCKSCDKQIKSVVIWTD